MPLLVTAVAMAVLTGATKKAQALHSDFNPLETFAPLVLPDPVNAYRSADGTPGPSYWQNRADYEIHATLDTSANKLTADETIVYTNNSPTDLDSVWLQLEQNAYRKDSRARFASGRDPVKFTEGFVFAKAEIEMAGATSVADTIVTDTRMQIRLPKPLSARGGKLKIHFIYSYDIPGKFGGRTAHDASPGGEIYDIAQWYPRMAVYDDLNGWNTLAYVGAEFYLDYGDFDYDVTVPSDMLVAASGELVNPEEVLTQAERTRLKEAQSSGKPVAIRAVSEIGNPASRPNARPTLTWRFHMENTRDVAFSASKAFAWDAARIDLPDGKTALAMSFYPAESASQDGWGRSTEYLKDSVENFSKRWFVYPWPAAVNVAGPVTAMEYPALTFNSPTVKNKDLFYIVAHEIGHSWFPMIVGTDERRNPWMDEGFNTFMDVYEHLDFANGVYAPKSDAEYSEGGLNPAETIIPALKDPDAPIVATAGDRVTEKYRHAISYFKSAYGLVLLREQILGPERFDWAFRKFIRDWAYKHPSPSDFFRAMNSASGEDLSWFWRGWYLNNWTFDLAVTGVKYTQNDPKKGSVVTIANLGKLVLPAVVTVDFKDGSTRAFRLPVETWFKRKEFSIAFDSTSPIARAVIDPDHALPDADRANNVYPLPKSH
ncbi:MAG TPA: M1 family metallopeptidase [Rhizomicrobium sp.]|nr:M1 family metallopeptidase [Rhizomicrobium sp.]